MRTTVESVERLWENETSYNSYMRRRWQEIAAMETALNISHEEEYGVAVTGAAAPERHLN